MARGTKAGRNDPCPCGSGKKFKRCCGVKQAADRGSRLMVALVILVIAGAFAAALVNFGDEGYAQPTAGKVWSPEHGHYH